MIRNARSYILAVCSMALAFSLPLSGCEETSRQNETPPAQQLSYDGLTPANPLRMSPDHQSFTMLIQVNGKYLTDSTRHAIVFSDGSNGHKSLFMAYTTPKDFYDALRQLNAVPGENMTMDNKETTHVKGDVIDMKFRWEGAQRDYDINEIVSDSNKKPIVMHFGGNLEMAANKKTGCLVCLDSCPVGIVSNEAYTYGAVEGRKEVKFTGNSVLPPDGSLAVVTFTVKKS